MTKIPLFKSLVDRNDYKEMFKSLLLQTPADSRTHFITLRCSEGNESIRHSKPAFCLPHMTTSTPNGSELAPT